MSIRLSRMISILVLLSLVFGPLLTTASVSAAPVSQESANGAIKVISPSAMGKLESLSAVTPNLPTKMQLERAAAIREQTDLAIPRPSDAFKSNTPTDPSIIQNAPVGNSMPSTIANFEGINNVNGVLPPDTNGDIGYDPTTGTKYYMEWVNLSFQIWNVTNPAAPVSLYGPAAGNTLFTSLGGICAANNDGDPIVLFDPLANRWMVSQFALGFPNNFHQCIAVSATGNPTGAWYLYDYQTSTTVMNDYPHFGVWPDGYYMTVNQFNGVSFAWAGAGVAVFEREQMLQGLSARMIYIDIGLVTLNYGGMLPSDLDGLNPPPVNAPNYFSEWDDSTWLGDPNDTLRIWEFNVDWVNTANTTFGLNSSYDPNLFIATSDIDPEVCAGFARSCIPQPGTMSKLDAISDRLMHRLAYRNFGTHQTIVGNRTVDAGGDHAAVYWFELRDTGSGWSMYQQGVYNPDSDHRWMGSISQDASGNMALGYSVSSGSTYPSIRYTGRLATDTLGTMPQGEATMIAGSGSQTSSSSRWGDYSMMGIDPVDDCTFWYNQEYYAATSNAGWQTRIGSFKFPSCTTGPKGTLTGTVTDGSSPLAGVTVTLSGGASTTTNASGVYTIIVPPGTYSATASKYGYIDGNASGINITNGGTTIQNFTLSSAPTHTVSGVVTDATTGWPLYAQINISGFPNGPVFTNPVTGAYSVNLVADTYTFTTTAMSGGYNVDSTPVVVAGDLTQNITLNANLTSCSAPGYTAGSTVWSEGFEGSFLPAGWNKYQTGANGFRQGTSGTTGSNGGAYSGSYYAWHNDDSGTQDSWLVTPQFSVPAGGATFKFWQRGYWTAYYTYHGVYVTTGASPDPGVSTYTELYTGNVAAENIWEQIGIDLSAYAGQNLYVAFRYQGDFSDEWYLDDVQVQQPCQPIASAGLVTGSVYDDNTLALVPSAAVYSGATDAVMIDSSADPATPDVTYVIGLPSGSNSMTAYALSYGSDTDSVSVSAGSTVGHDFYLVAGLLSLNPADLSFGVPVNGSDSAPVTLNNTGSVSANYEIFALDGAPPILAPTGPFAPNTRHLGPKNLNDRDARKLRTPSIPQGVPPLAAGDVTLTWSTGLTYAWGIGFNTDVNDLWLGNIAAAGGDDLNYRFITTGTNTGDTIDVSGMGGVYGADMTYNPYTNTLWQVNVGGDNCIYELDLNVLMMTGNKICPAFGTSQRGLAYDPVSDTYYSGSWNDGIINHFTPDGTLLSAVSVGLDISGLAYNPVTQHLFVLSNTDSSIPGTTGSYDVTVLDASSATLPDVGGFNVGPGMTAYSQAGMEIDCSGNLWIVDQDAQTVLRVDSGETGVCNWQSGWLSATPVSGTIAGSGNTTLTVSVDATGKTAGTSYQGYLRIANNTPYGFVNLPVTMNVAGNSIPDPWAGGVVIESDQNVVAVGRPHLGAQVASYIGVNAGGTTQYVPMLFKDAYGGSYDAALYIQNLAASTANITIEFRTDSGTLVHTINDTIVAKASKGYWLPSISGLGSSFVGGAKITADQAVLAVGRPHIGSEVMTYNGFSSGSTTAYLPMFFKNGFGSYNTALYIQNVSNSTANMQIEYLNLDGTVACTDNDTLGANASRGYWSLLVTCDTGSLPSGFVGGVKVTSDQNIVAVGRPHLGTQVTTYNGFSSGATTSYVPMLFKGAFGGSYNAALYLQNTSGSVASVTIEYLDSAGAVVATQNVNLNAGAISSIWVPSVAGVPADFAGGARITSDQAIVAVGRPHLGTEITAYNGAASGGLNAYLSMLFKNAYGVPYNAAFYIQNVTGSTANVNISFYDSAGALSCIKSISLAANATQGFWMPTTTCAP
ncbi:MAG: carboxypeptidase regulatory-like domain-containing protein [Chloroflexi bacterium]|nr:carboxypeptidase regulatory-like domain-containing protein [Chloroflexota bacterium]